MRRTPADPRRGPTAWLFALLTAAWLAVAIGTPWPGLAAPSAAPTRAASSASRAPAPAALVLDLEGPINPVTSRYVRQGLVEAERRGARVVVLRLETPGGLDGAMREIVRAILGSPVPVVAYVAPSGARAASAGMFIVLAAHVAAMAPNTVIGAAHPVGGGGEEIKGPLGDKVTNDAAAYARSLAAQRGRNARWAEDAVRKSVSLAAEEALAKRVIDRVAPDVGTLLRSIHGMRVTTAAGPLTLDTRGLTPAPMPMSDVERLLLAVSNPAIALLLLNVGVLGVVFELQNPGAFLPGVVGVICLLLGFFALGMVPVNGAGVALLLFGLALLVAELFVPSYGVLSVGGVAALVLGSLVLFEPGPEGFVPPVGLILAISAGAGTLILGAVAMGLRAQRRPIHVGVEDLIGRGAVVREPLGPAGLVLVEGELWRAVAPGPGVIPPGERVIVDRVDGLTLHVRRQAEPERGPG